MSGEGQPKVIRVGSRKSEVRRYEKSGGRQVKRLRHI